MLNEAKCLDLNKCVRLLMGNCNSHFRSKIYVSKRAGYRFKHSKYFLGPKLQSFLKLRSS